MTEAGGPSTQAGIYYQNTIAALFMGRMIDTRARSVRDRVVSVRVEAPAHVDDIVVRHADGTTRYVQAKLALRQSDTAWEGLWRALSRQLETMGDADRLSIVLGDPGQLGANLRECARRTDGANATEWRDRLSQEQKTVVDAVEVATGKNDEQALRLLRAIDVEIVTEPMLERDLPPLWMPDILDPGPLVAILRDMAGGGARTRALFEPAKVRSQLRDQHGIAIPDPASWGSDLYRSAVLSTLAISVPGTNIVRPVEEGFIWPVARRPDAERRSDFDDEWPSGQISVEPDTVDLSAFPSADLDKVVVVAGPGFGKSTLLLALTAKTLKAGLLPVVVTAPDLSNSDLEIGEHIERRVNASHGVSIDWRQAAEAGLVVLLVDGLDEVGADRRSVILDRLRRYSAVNPSVDWVLTVRDAAALAAPTEAKLVELAPLDDDGIRRFIRAYCPDNEDVYRRLNALFDSQPEMKRLARIPLFLTMLLATLGRIGRLPRDRTDVIEDYLSLLLEPAAFKPSDRIQTDPRTMRDVAQRAAFHALELDEIGLSRRLLEGMTPISANSRIVIDDLVKCGMLRRPELARYEFPFPIIQEYLAGRYLVEARADDIPRRLSSVAKRPWAQAIQFALEGHPNPVGIVDDLLAQPDDAFDTHLRLLGRCVVNGMKVTEEQRRTITLRLLSRWEPESFSRAQAIGNLIADGFTRPLIPELRQRLFDRGLLYSGSGRILCDLADDALSLEVLCELLSERVGSLLHLHEFQPEVDRIGREAFRLYIRAARVWADLGEEVKGVAALIDHLSAANVDQTDVRAAVGDGALPVSIRVAALSLANPAQPIACGEATAREALDESGWLGTTVAARAALRAGLPASTLVGWAQALATTTGPEFIGKLISQCDPVRRPAFISEVLATHGLQGAVRHHALVFAASFGNEDALDELLSLFGDVGRDVVAATCAILGHFPTVAAAEKVLDALEARAWDATDRRSISSSLQTGLSGKLVMSSFSSGSIADTEIHPGTSVMLPLLARWATEDDYDPCDKLRMSLDLVRLGQGDALAEVKPRLRAALADRTTDQRDLHFQEHVIGNAVDLLQDRRDPLPLAELEAIARERGYNARSSALRAIARQGTAEACYSLVGLYPELTDASSRDALLNALQTLASQLRLRVMVEDGALVVSSG